MDYTVHGILQDRILEWVAFPFSRASSQPRDRTQVPHIAGDSLPAEPQGKPTNIRVGSLSLLQGILLIQESNQRLLHCKQIFFTNWAITESISHQICYSSSWFLNGFRVSLISLEVELGVGADEYYFIYVDVNRKLNRLIHFIRLVILQNLSSRSLFLYKMGMDIFLKDESIHPHNQAKSSSC